MFKKILTLSFLLFSFLIGNLALAQVDLDKERILNFSSDIQVNKDASILVTEDITVHANGDTIKHGIYRDFPTIYKDKNGSKYVVGFEIKDVKVNGQPENYMLESLSNGVRVKIGKANFLLASGVYTYSLTYRATRELGFFADHDELYWNVTGNGWTYNIEKSSAMVTLPAGINGQEIKTEAYTGLSGSKENAAYTYVLADGRVSFVTARVLAPHEGLTIAVSWPKGFVTAPTVEQIRSDWLRDNKAIFFGLFGLLITLIYYFIVWNKYGRDPKGKTIIAQYEPPKALSPAEARYILRRYFDDKCLVADTISLAVKGYLTISNENDGYNLSITNKEYDSSLVLGSEKILLDSLFKTSDTIKIGGQSSSLVAKKNKLSRWLTENYKKNYFTLNIKYLIIGLILSALSIATIASTEGAEAAGLIAFMSVWLSVWTVGVVALSVNNFRLWIKVWGQKGKFGDLTKAIFFLCFSLPFYAGEVFAIYIIYDAVSLWFILSLVCFITLNIVFYFLLRQYTEIGLRLAEEIKGFKLFLSVTEEDRMNFHNPPERTPELFEKYLPYALALGVENRWAEQFTEVFKNKDMENVHPLWYSSSIYGSSFVSGFSSSFSSSISSAATPPGHSSGFGGGGGGSGGGGGGGGGGGW